MNQLIHLLSENPLTFLIPVFSAVVGYGTNWLAIKMMFYPTNFMGIPPFLGWQGVVPANAHRVAAHTTELITTKLIDLKGLFRNFNPDEFIVHLDAVLDETTEEVLLEAQKKIGPMWAALDATAQQQVRGLVRTEIGEVAREILKDFSENIEEILDLKHVIVSVVEEDRRMFSELFMHVGRNEFKFIERSGGLFGFLFGIPQLIVWLFFPVWAILPVAGFLVGYATNWLALKLIFEPAEPRKIGPWVLQGMFHKRKEAVSQDFADLVSKHFLNAENIVRISTTGETGERMMNLVERNIEKAIAKYDSHPMAAMVKGMVDMDELRTEISTRIREDMQKPGGFLHIFADKSIDIFGELYERLRVLDPASFESILRTPLKQDEWKLIIVGGLLGFGAGAWQVAYIFGDMLLSNNGG